MEEPDTNEAKDKNGAEKKSGSDLFYKFQFYAIVLGCLGMDFYLLYELGFDSQLTWPILAGTFLGLGYLILARKKGWLGGRRNE